MRKKTETIVLSDIVRTLVRNFGAESVRAAFISIAGDEISPIGKTLPKIPRKQKKTTILTVPAALENMRDSDFSRYELLNKFYARLTARSILTQSQDIYHFAQLIGMKNISGKSRKDLIPKLMHFLIALPAEQLEEDLRNAEGISERERQQGFSVLTDKLLGEK